MSLGEGKLAQSTGLTCCACQLFDAGTCSNVQDFALVFQLASREVTYLCIVLPANAQSLFEILAIKDAGKASSFGTRGSYTGRVCLYSCTLKGQHLFGDFCFDTDDLFLFDLTFSEQALYVVILMNEYVMLSTSQLELGGDLRVRAVNASILVGCSKVSLGLAFSNNSAYESSVLDDIGDHGACFLMTIDEGNSDIISASKVAKQGTSEDRTCKWRVR
jgi:hypothetical protein